METARLSSKGQVVLPKAIRQALQVATGSQLGFEMIGEQAMVSVLRKKTAKVGDGYGLLKGKGKKIPPDKEETTLRRAMKKEAR